MDPNAALERLRAAYRAWERDPQYSVAEELAEVSKALDEWLSHGGALPEAWSEGNGF